MDIPTRPAAAGDHDATFLFAHDVRGRHTVFGRYPRFIYSKAFPPRIRGIRAGRRHTRVTDA